MCFLFVRAFCALCFVWIFAIVIQIAGTPVEVLEWSDLSGSFPSKTMSRWEMDSVQQVGD